MNDAAVTPREFSTEHPNPENPMKSTRCRLIALASVILTLSSGLSAQTRAPASRASEPSDEAVQMSEFTVQAGADRGYIASEAVTGSRVATKIADLPYPISVLTSEFMQDFDVFDFSSSINGLSAGLTGASDEGSVTLRGTSTNNNFILRNGFYRLGMVDRVNTDRIEVIKGPNAAVYGASNPTGVVNVITKNPKFGTPYQKIRYTTGPYDFNRLEANFNQPLGSLGGVKLANLISVAGSNEHTAASWPSSKQSRTLGDILAAKLKDGSMITAEFEWTRTNIVPGFSSNIPFEGVKGNLTPVVRKDLTYFNQVGNVGAFKNRSSYSAYLTYEKRFNPHWSNRINGYWYRRPELQLDPAGNSTVFDPATQTFTARTIQWDRLNQDGGAFQIDTVADYPLFGGQFKSKTLFTIDYSQNWRMREVKDYNTTQYPANGPLSIVNPNYAIPPISAFNIANRNDKTRADGRGAFISEQVRTGDDRWIGFLSLRRDLVTYNLNYGNQYSVSKGVFGLKTPGQVVHYESSAWSPSIGTNYKVTKHLAVYASYSHSFAPQLQVSKLGTPPLPNETAKGWDYGIKANFLDDRLVFTMGGYYINREGIKTTVKDPLTGISETVAGGSQNTKGLEFEGSWRATDNFTLVANYGYANAKITNNGSSTTDVGQEPAGTPIDLGTVAGTYRFTGRAAGLSLHLKVSYVGRAYPFSTQTTFQRYIVTAGYYTVDPAMTYAWKWRKTKQSIRLSSRNVLDRDYVTSDFNLGAKRAVFFAYSIEH
jgi:iron complex outermembrane recepter protein